MEERIKIGKVFKFVITVVILLAVFSALYYFVIFLPREAKEALGPAEQEKWQRTEGEEEQENEEEFLFSMRQECLQEGQKLYQEDKKSGGTLLNPEYTYNQELNTCLYFCGRLDDVEGAGYVLVKYVIDVFSNQEILSIYVENGEVIPMDCDGCMNSNEEFERRRAELFD